MFGILLGYSNRRNINRTAANSNQVRQIYEIEAEQAASAVAEESSPTQKTDFAGANTRGDQGMGFSQLITFTFSPMAVRSKSKATSPRIPLPKALFVVTWR
jgi:hypothetical protein